VPAVVQWATAPFAAAAALAPAVAAAAAALQLLAVFSRARVARGRRVNSSVDCFGSRNEMKMQPAPLSPRAFFPLPPRLSSSLPPPSLAAIDRAMDACPGAEGETVGQRTDALLEWLCLHLEEEELPKGFDPRGRNLDVIRPGQDFGASVVKSSSSGGGGGGGGGDGGSGAVATGGAGDSSGGGGGVESATDTVEGRLLGYGFGHAEVAAAIAGAGAAAGAAAGGGAGGEEGSLNARLLRPLEILAGGLATTAGRRKGRGGGGDEEVQTEEEGREAVDEEVMSLEAIYDGAVAVAPDMPEVCR